MFRILSAKPSLENNSSKGIEKLKGMNEKIMEVLKELFVVISG